MQRFRDDGDDGSFSLANVVFSDCSTNPTRIFSRSGLKFCDLVHCKAAMTVPSSEPDLNNHCTKLRTTTCHVALIDVKEAMACSVVVNLSSMRSTRHRLRVFRRAIPTRIQMVEVRASGLQDGRCPM